MKRNIITLSILSGLLLGIVWFSQAFTRSQSILQNIIAGFFLTDFQRESRAVR